MKSAQLIQTPNVATMLQLRMRPDRGQLSVELAVLQHIYACSDANMSLRHCWWFIIVGNDSIEGNTHWLMQPSHVAAMLQPCV